MTRGVGGKGPANIMKHLGGINFPATRDDVLQTAREGEGPDTGGVLGILNHLPEKEYQSVADIMHEIGKTD